MGSKKGGGQKEEVERGQTRGRAEGGRKEEKETGRSGGEVEEQGSYLHL